MNSVFETFQVKSNLFITHSAFVLLVYISMITPLPFGALLYISIIDEIKTNYCSDKNRVRFFANWSFQ